MARHLMLEGFICFIFISPFFLVWKEGNLHCLEIFADCLHHFSFWAQMLHFTLFWTMTFSLPMQLSTTKKWSLLKFCPWLWCSKNAARRRQKEDALVLVVEQLWIGFFSAIPLAWNPGVPTCYNFAAAFHSYMRSNKFFPSVGRLCTSDCVL